MLINQLQQDIYMKDQLIQEQMRRPETSEVELQTSFETQVKIRTNLKLQSYRHDLQLFVEKFNQREEDEQQSVQKEKLAEEFQVFLAGLTDDSQLLHQDQPEVRDLIRDCFKLQNSIRQTQYEIFNDQVNLLKSQKQTQQNISPSAYEILKQDYDKLLREQQITKEKLKMAQDFNQQQRKQMEQTKKKVEERDQVILLMQETFEKELENLYTENDVKKFARELNVLYEQNQELHKMNKRMKYELRLAQERENQFIKIIKKSPDLVRMLDMEDSSILDTKVPQY